MGRSRRWRGVRIGRSPGPAEQVAALSVEDLDRLFADGRKNVAGEFVPVDIDKASVHNCELLVLDDFLTTPITGEAAAELLTMIAAREGRGSIVLNSQFDPEDWYRSLHDAVIAESILNRIVSTAELVRLDGPNMRRHRHQEATT
jgi:sugar/nucleoside kinase (ribokinase family)